ncbi:MAG: hypothetical protein EOM77_04375 [Bacteroidia bacterium]|nr:hypothetical protein [Bacteroidia bacterium]
MKRAELEALLQGVENAKEVIDKIMAINGMDIEAHKTAKEKAEAERNELETKLSEYAEFTPEKVEAFKAFNPEEFETLKKFKVDTETAQEFAKKETAGLNILKGKGFSEKAAKLILKAERESVNGIEFDENGAAKNADKFFEPIGKNYADFVTKTEQDGAKAATPPAPTAQKPETLASAVAEKMGTLK